MKLLLLGAADLERALPMRAAVTAMKEAFAQLSRGEAVAPQRLALPVPAVGGTTLVKPALTPDGLGAKLVSVFPLNRELGLPVTPGLMVLLSPGTGQPEAVLDGTALTALRTGAASGAATDLLARPVARTAALFGCGGQARAQVLALDAVRELRTVRVYARGRKSLRRFVAATQPGVRARLVAAASPEEAVAGADVVTTATTSGTPVFPGRSLAPGAHVNAIGSFTPTTRELDEDLVGRSRIFVDSREAALAEAGDLLSARDAGATGPEEWTELGEVVAGLAAGRRSPEEITLFKSVGIAVQDVAAAARAVAKARELGLGTEVEL